MSSLITKKKQTLEKGLEYLRLCSKHGLLDENLMDLLISGIALAAEATNENHLSGTTMNDVVICLASQLMLAHVDDIREKEDGDLCSSDS